MGNDKERKQHFLQHKGNHSNNKEVYSDGSKRTGRKASIHTVEMTAIIAMREIQKIRGHVMGNIYRLNKFNGGH